MKNLKNFVHVIKYNYHGAKSAQRILTIHEESSRICITTSTNVSIGSTPSFPYQVSGDVVLLRNQTDKKQNAIYCMIKKLLHENNIILMYV